MLDPFAADGDWLRCALHAHTTRSDGDLEPHELVRRYEEAGFDVLAITDHWIRTPPPAAKRLLVLPGAELDAFLPEARRYAHVLALGVEEDPEPPADPDAFPGLAETAAWVSEHGGVAFIAHTYWSGVGVEEFASCDGLAGLEVYNAACQLEVGRGYAGLQWDEVLERRRNWLGIAVDDSHHPDHDCGLAWVWTRCEERSAAAVLEALREGRFYSSTGPEILDVVVTNDAVEVRSTPSTAVTLLAGRQKGARVSAGRPRYPGHGRVLKWSDSGEITAVRLERPPRAPYGRVEVTDAHGQTAWTNPLWI
jgi:hypothetical protein